MCPLSSSSHGSAGCSWGFPRPAEVLIKLTAPYPLMRRAWRHTHTLSYHSPRLPHLLTPQSTTVTTTNNPTCVGGQEILKTSVVLLTQPDFFSLCIITHGHYLVPDDRSSNCYVEVLPGISAFRRGCHAAFQKKYRGCPVTPGPPIAFGRMQSSRQQPFLFPRRRSLFVATVKSSVLPRGQHGNLPFPISAHFRPEWKASAQGNISPQNSEIHRIASAVRLDFFPGHWPRVRLLRTSILETKSSQLGCGGNNHCMLRAATCTR